jgi:hypothetical protein
MMSSKANDKVITKKKKKKPRKLLQSISITSSSSLSVALSIKMRPSSSNLRFLLGLVISTLVVPFVLTRLVEGPISRISSSGADRLSVAGGGVEGLAFRGGNGKGEGRTNGEASIG